MTALADVLATDGAALVTAAARIGGTVAFDPAAIRARDASLGLRPPGLWSPNRSCRLVRAADGWIAVNLARDDDIGAVPAWLGTPLDMPHWRAAITTAPTLAVAELRERAVLLHLPVAVVGEAAPAPPRVLAPRAVRRAGDRLRVIDLSALWAGPLCGAVLAAAGADVTRYDGVTRRDPTADIAPELDARLNGAKRRACFDPHAPAALVDAIAVADVLITNARPLALARMGLTPDILFAANPGLLWVAITAYGWTGDSAQRVGFGDDCAAAGGLVDWRQTRPRFLGDALADPLSGIAASTAAMNAIADGVGGLVDVALAGVAGDTAFRMVQ